VAARVDGTPITLDAINHALAASVTGPTKSLLANASAYGPCIAAFKKSERESEKFRKLQRAREEKALRAQLSAEEQAARKRKDDARLRELRKRGLKGEAPELFERRRPVTDAQREQNCQSSYKNEREQTLRNLIMQIWNEREAHELGISVSENDVAKQVLEDEAQQGSGAKGSHALEQRPHRSEAELRTNAKYSLLDQRIRQSIEYRVSSSQSELEKYYDAHKQGYWEPESRTVVLAHIASRSAAEAIAKDRGSGGLAAAAQKHTVKVSSETSRCLRTDSGALARNEMGTSTLAACTAKRGTISGPIVWVGWGAVPEGYVLVEVTSIKPAIQPTFAQVEASRKQQLVYEAQGLAISRFEEASRLKWQAHTECAAGYVIDACKEYKPPTPIKGRAP
jgi:hypothetical protein